MPAKVVVVAQYTPLSKKVLVTTIHSTRRTQRTQKNYWGSPNFWNKLWTPALHKSRRGCALFVKLYFSLHLESGAQSEEELALFYDLIELKKITMQWFAIYRWIPQIGPMFHRLGHCCGKWSLQRADMCHPQEWPNLWNIGPIYEISRYTDSWLMSVTVGRKIYSHSKQGQ